MLPLQTFALRLIFLAAQQGAHISSWIQLHTFLSAMKHNMPWWTSLVATLTDITIRADLPSAEIDACRSLLYDVFFVEQGWDPPAPNASNVQANHDKRQFEDDFDSRAVWLGAFKNDGEIVAVMRVLDQQLLGKLEVERYVDFLRSYFEPASHLIEFNRFAAKKGFRHGAIVPLLQMLGCRVGKELGAQYVVTAISPSSARRVAMPHGWIPLDCPQFKYHESDPGEVQAISLRLGSIPQVQRAIIACYKNLRGFAQRQASPAAPLHIQSRL